MLRSPRVSSITAADPMREPIGKNMVIGFAPTARCKEA
jgi:hypothetical protein